MQIIEFKFDDLLKGQVIIVEIDYVVKRLVKPYLPNSKISC